MSELEETWSNTSSFLIDEVGAIGATLYAQISNQLNKIKNCKNDEIFGKINIFNTGDLLQLPPISKSIVGELFDVMLQSTVHLIVGRH